MKQIAGILLLVVMVAPAATGQTTIYWKRDYIYDPSGNAIAVITPMPSDTTVPSAPTNVSSTGTTTTSVSLSWTGSTDSGGSGLAGYLVYRGPVPVTSVNTASFTDVGLMPATTYQYRIVAFDNAFNYSDFSSTAQVSTGALTNAPTALSATTLNAGQIDLTWTAPGAGAPDHYGIWRLSGGGWSKVAETSSTTYGDTAVTSGTAYVYRVASEDASDMVLGWTNADVATAIVFTDAAITVQSTAIKAVHINELRTAVNAIRAAAGMNAATWTDSSLSGVPVKAVHVTELRSRLGEALNFLGLSAASYTDTTLAGIAIKRVHIYELRQRVQ